MLAILPFSPRASAETVRLTDSAFARTTVAVTSSIAAQYHVYFTKNPMVADCGLYLTDSAFAQSTVRVVKNPLYAQITVRQVDKQYKANTVVYLAPSTLQAFGQCDFAAALLAK